ncbi:hypothetical protein BHE74_00022926 [Ensete ventricosum]|nr:hypothetical protein BHE74_00022926 [Ensete ventricosum]
MPFSSSITIAAAPSYAAATALKTYAYRPYLLCHASLPHLPAAALDAAAASFFLSCHYRCLAATASRYRNPPMHSHRLPTTAFFLPCHYRCPITSSSPIAAQPYLLPLPLPSLTPSSETLLLPSIIVIDASAIFHQCC